MRISIATGPLLPVPAIRGGAVHRMWDQLARELAARGHEVTVHSKADRDQPHTEKRDGVRYVRRGGFRQSRWVLFDLVRNLLYSIATMARLPASDILVCNDFWLPVLTPLLRPGAGRVVCVALRFPKGQYRLYSRAACVVAGSTAVARAIVGQAPAMGAKTVVIPCPVDVAKFRSFSIPRAKVEGRLKILYVGRLHPEKGIEILIEAVRAMAERRAVMEVEIVGPSLMSDGGGGSSYQQLLLRMSEGLPIVFSGPEFRFDRLVQIYQSADIFCYPSVAESGEAFGVAPLEAMAAGLCPVVSSLECFSDFVHDGKSGVVFDHRAVDRERKLADALAKLDSDRELLKLLKRRARDLAKAFDIPVVAARYERLFRSIGLGP